MPKEDTYPMHYIWVGPEASGDYLGSDTIGPELMRDRTSKTPIQYWCLEEEVSHYEKVFNDRAIKVHAIEPYLKENHTDFYNFFIVLRDTAKSHDNPEDKARDFTTLKACMQFYLQTRMHGFFMDCNIIPAPDAKEIPSKRLKAFTVPDVSGSTSQYYDGWLMFSPADDKDAIKRFEYYYKEAKGEFYDRDKDTLSEINRIRLANAFIDTPKLGPVNGEKTALASTSALVDCLRVLGFQKRYNNAHKKRKGMGSMSLLVRILKNTPDAFAELAYYMKKRGLSSTTLLDLVSRDGSVNKTSLLGFALEEEEVSNEMIAFLIDAIEEPSELFDEKRSLWKQNSLFKLILYTNDKTLIVAMFKKVLLIHFEDESVLLDAINNHLFSYTSKGKTFHVSEFKTLGDFIDRLILRDNPFLTLSIDTLLKEGVAKIESLLSLKSLVFYAYKTLEKDDFSELLEALEPQSVLWEGNDAHTGVMYEILEKSHHYYLYTDKMSLLLKLYIKAHYESETDFLSEIQEVFLGRLWPLKSTPMPDFSSLDNFMKAFSVEKKAEIVYQMRLLLSNGPGLGAKYTMYHAIKEKDPDKLQAALLRLPNPHAPILNAPSDLSKAPIRQIFRSRDERLFRVFFEYEIENTYQNEKDFLYSFNALMGLKLTGHKSRFIPFESVDSLIAAFFERSQELIIDSLEDVADMMCRLGPLDASNQKDYYHALNSPLDETSTAKTHFFKKEDEPLMGHLKDILKMRAKSEYHTALK